MSSFQVFDSIIFSIFGYIMEHRTYKCNGSGQSEKMQRDLSSSPHQEEHLEENGEFPMIRRTIGRIPHVGIVGAGLAGLRCADILLKHGVKVTILEGRDRIGGRVRRFQRSRETSDVAKTPIGVSK